MQLVTKVILILAVQWKSNFLNIFFNIFEQMTEIKSITMGSQSFFM